MHVSGRPDGLRRPRDSRALLRRLSAQLRVVWVSPYNGAEVVDVNYLLLPHFVTLLLPPFEYPNSFPHIFLFGFLENLDFGRLNIECFVLEAVLLELYGCALYLWIVALVVVAYVEIEVKV